MSALTKVFVVLHVVLSMLLAGGLVVFINRVENFNQQAQAAAARAVNAESLASDLKTEIGVVRTNMQAAVDRANNEVDDRRQEIDALNAQLLDRQGQIAQRDATIASTTAAARSAEQALGVAQENQGRLQEQLIASRTAYDKAQQQLTEANLTVSDQSNQIQVLRRQLRFANEQLASMQETQDREGQTRGDGFDRPAVATAPRNVNGVVRATQTINGIKYATISVGSADAIQKGMQLRVLGGASGSDFLGYITVTSVEPHEAVGRLSGPRVNEVNDDDQVVTRL